MLWGLVSFTSLAWMVLAVAVAVVVKWILSVVNTPEQDGTQGGGKTHQGSKTGDRGSANSHANAEAPPEGEQPEEESNSSSSFTEGIKLKVLQVPNATGEIARILKATDFYSVLEVSRTADSMDIKKAYRGKQMATHPDKNNSAAGALEASQRVNSAYDTLGDEIRRRQYDLRLTDEEMYGPRSQRRGGGANPSSFAELAKAFDEYVRNSMPPPPEGALYPTIDPAAYDTWGDAPNHSFRMACSCGYDHMCVKVPARTAQRARMCNCKQCGIWGQYLPARDNDMWFEASSSLMRHFAPESFIRAYRCAGIHVYDVTPWAKCNGLLSDPAGNPAPTNTHYVPFRLNGSSNARGGQQRQKKAEKEQNAAFGYNQFKGKGINSHKTSRTTNKKKRR